MKRSKSLEKSLDDVKYEQYVNNLHDRLPQLEDPKDIDCQRWPWELLQNAKDTVVKRKNIKDRNVDVTIKYYLDKDGEKKLYFEHNGDHFTNKAITGLIWKFSAEKRNEQTTEDGLTRDKQSTGRFGTGFMTTHALSLTVDVSGSLFHDDPEVNRNVSVDFTLHREGPDDEAYRKGVDKTEREIDENMDKRAIPNGEVLPTRFTYHLNRDASDKAALMGIENVRANAAQTMLFCPSVRSITVLDEINKLNFKISRENYDDRKNVVKETIFKEERDNVVEPIIRRFISLEIEEYSEEISSHWKVENRNLRLHVAVEVDRENNIIPIPSTSPAVYCSLPLIGFESMTLPFYINSNDFEPETERTALYLMQKEYEYHSNEVTGVDEKYFLKSGINWAILRKSLPLYERVVDYLIENNYNKRYNLINGLGEILKNSWKNETKNCLAARFVVPLRSMLVRKNLVRTKNGYRSIESDVKFVECSKECDLHILYDICKTIYGDNLTVEEENINWISLKWGKFVFESDFNEKISDNDNPSFSTIKYDKVANFIENSKRIQDLNLLLYPKKEYGDAVEEIQLESILEKCKLDWLNKFYEWIVTSKITNIADKKIVPNRLGIFCSIEQGCKLKDASDISTEIFDFMKSLSINWDENLLLEGVKHITLAKETKDNIITAIKEQAKNIRESKECNKEKLNKLLPILLALPICKEGESNVFLNKRRQIISILKTMFPSNCIGLQSVYMDLNAEMWEATDRWFMNLVVAELASRKRLDVIETDYTEEQKTKHYCTSEWLSDTINFMFDHSYLHQENISYNEDDNNTYSIIPNRYGVFCPINQLYTQGLIPDELLNNELNKTGYDINATLLYKGFGLHKKVTISDIVITDLATLYNNFFKGNMKEEDKLSVAIFLIHLIPSCGDQYQRTRELYNTFIKASEDARLTTEISTSDLNIWMGANEYLIKHLSSQASGLMNVCNIGKEISIQEDKEQVDFFALGMKWLNDLVVIKKKFKVETDANWGLIPDWHGNLHSNDATVMYNGKLLKEYENVECLVQMINGDLWTHFPNSEREEDDDTITSCIVNPMFYFVEEYQNNTVEKFFSLVDRVVYYCSEKYGAEWKPLLKNSIQTLLTFFDKNQVSSHNNEDPKLSRLFPNTYTNRKNLSYDFIYDAETKARFSRMNDNYLSDEIDVLIENKEFVKKILKSKDLPYIQDIINEFPGVNFESILNILRREQGDFDMAQLQQSIPEKRKREIGDKGECFVYEMLCKHFDKSNITWSNFAPHDNNARIVNFNGNEYRLTTTSHDFDFIIIHNNKRIYVEVKTTVGNINKSNDFPLIFETKEWVWIDNNNNQEDIHYIVRVFDIEGVPKAYYLKQALSIE